MHALKWANFDLAQQKMCISFGCLLLLLVLSGDCNEAHIRVLYPAPFSFSRLLAATWHNSNAGDIIKMQHK